MKDGKKALAIRHVQGALEHLQSLIEKHNETSSTLITGSTLENLEQAIDKVSPLIRIVSEKAGAKTRLIPRLLNDRRRRRTGIMYVLESIKTPGKLSFQDRLGQELFRILEGTSKVMDKRDQVHKTGLANRSNVILNDRKKKGRF